MTTSTSSGSTKRVESILASPPVHWVGDGFPVSSAFSPQTVEARLSPYILMDYAGPARFEPSTLPRGVDTHPHRGFETVTVVYQGELEHRDSAGNSGSIGPGDVQWMTAAGGVLHEEKHSAAFTRAGGVLEMAQLWVNLPAKDKMRAPGYQTLRCDSIPVIDLPDGAGQVRLIAGAFNGTPGAARTFTPVILWDVSLRPGARAALPLPPEWNAALFMRHGAVRLDGGRAVTARQVAILTRDGGGVTVHEAAGPADGDHNGEEGTGFLVLGGEPIDEPVVAYGPFVMNTTDEIRQAVSDVREGRFGRLG